MRKQAREGCERNKGKSKAIFHKVGIDVLNWLYRISPKSKQR
jgi:hypothetical protein